MRACCCAALLLSIVAGPGCRGASPADTTWSGDTRQQIEAWRAKHESDYRREWATIEGLHILKPGTQTAGSDARNDVVLTAAAPPRLGRFTVGSDQVTFAAEPGAGITINGKPPTTPATLRDDGERETDEIEANGVTVVVHKTGERISLRVRDPHGKRASEFRGFSWFPIDPAYRVAGRFIPDAAPRTAKVVNTFGDVDSYRTEGVIEFTLQGRTLRLRPFTTRPKRFYIVFKDASSGVETYDAARFLYADLRDDGTTILDFNEAYNPPCSFNPYTTCPIPLPENRLPVKVLAGEKQYTGHVELPANASR